MPIPRRFLPPSGPENTEPDGIRYALTAAPPAMSSNRGDHRSIPLPLGGDLAGLEN